MSACRIHAGSAIAMEFADQLIRSFLGPRVNSAFRKPQSPGTVDEFFQANLRPSQNTSNGATRREYWMSFTKNQATHDQSVVVVEDLLTPHVKMMQPGIAHNQFERPEMRPQSPIMDNHETCFEKVCKLNEPAIKSRVHFKTVFSNIDFSGLPETFLPEGDTTNFRDRFCSRI